MSMISEAVAFLKNNFVGSIHYDITDKILVFLYLRHRTLFYIVLLCLFVLCFTAIHCYRLVHKKEPDFWSIPFFNKPGMFILTSFILALTGYAVLLFFSSYRFQTYLFLVRKYPH